MAVLKKKSPYTPQQQQQTYFPAIPGTLDLYKTGFTHGTLHILDTDKQTRLYEIKTHSWTSPDISLYRPAATAAAPNANPTLCGSAKFHTWSRTIDLQIGGNRPIPLQATGVFSSTRTFESCVGELKWKKDMRLFNAREELLATFISVTAVSKWGRFEMTPLVAEGGQRLVDEVVLSGVALLEQDRREEKASAAGEVGSAAGGAVAAAVG
ncbi:hypothetical protein MMC31_001661 [Peltigera leucophlebia]|nr:hypothetical protein [Peltigera leucophlebia]